MSVVKVVLSKESVRFASCTMWLMFNSLPHGLCFRFKLWLMSPFNFMYFSMPKLQNLKLFKTQNNSFNVAFKIYFAVRRITNKCLVTWSLYNLVQKSWLFRRFLLSRNLSFKIFIDSFTNVLMLHAKKKKSSRNIYWFCMFTDRYEYVLSTVYIIGTTCKVSPVYERNSACLLHQ